MGHRVDVHRQQSFADKARFPVEQHLRATRPTRAALCCAPWCTPSATALSITACCICLLYTSDAADDM
eukprot:9762940-Alexandrium_andersonii.AAC.1